MRKIEGVRDWTIYGIRIAGTDCIRYVGMTCQPHSRRLVHLAGNDLLTGQWVREHGPAEFVVLETLRGTQETAVGRETEWISKVHASHGLPMLNRLIYRLGSTDEVAELAAERLRLTRRLRQIKQRMKELRLQDGTPMRKSYLPKKSQENLSSCACNIAD